MSNEPPLTERVAALEQAIIKGLPIRRTSWPLILSGFLLLACFATANMWLIRDHSRRLLNQSSEHKFWIICHDGSTSTERTTAFLDLVRYGNTEWKSAKLVELDLAGADLAGVDIQSARMNDSNLYQVDFNGAELSRTQFRTCSMKGAFFRKSILVESDMMLADLTEATLREANCRGASFQQAIAHKTKFILADLTEGQFLMSDLTEANFAGANLSGANLQAAKLVGANLTLARLTEADLTDTDFTDSNWWRARGLSPDTIERLRDRYAPSKNADPDFLADYELWAQQQLSGSTGRRN